MSDKKYIPIDPEDHDRIVKGQTDGLSIEMALYNAGYQRGKNEALHPSEIAGVLPSDEQVSKWFSENIDRECSASSAIYKFRLWLRELQARAGEI